MRRFIARPLARDVGPVAERATLTSELNAAFTASFVKGKAKGQKSKGSGLDSCSIGDRQDLTQYCSVRQFSCRFFAVALEAEEVVEACNRTGCSAPRRGHG